MHRENNGEDKTRSRLDIDSGTVVGHYRIVREIGTGGMGEVYLAEDIELGREVALKFLREDICRDEGSRIRFKREAQAAAKLNHPNIVTIYEVAEYRERPYLAMENVAGRSCRDVIKCGDCGLEDIVDFAVQICDGLREAHEAGVIHRDVKPSNIILDNKGRCRLLDFGLADIQGTEKITKTGFAIGTLGYMSPEQVEGKHADQRSDIFSLGVVLYEMITGKQPFMKSTGAATLNAIAVEKPEPLARYKTGVPDNLQRIVDKALEKNSGARYQHISDMQVDLRRVGQELGRVSADTSDIYVGRPSRPRRFRMLPVSLAALAVAIVLTLALVPSARNAVKKMFGMNVVPGRKHLAVLPFANVGDHDVNQAFCDGLMETLASKMTQLEQFQDSFWVIPASEVRQAGILSAHQARRSFGVTLAVTGSVQFVGEDVRMTVNLIDAANNRQLNSIVIDASVRDVAALQDSIVFEVAEMLEVEIMPESERILTAGGTDDHEAYALYLKGRGMLRRLNGGNLDSAIILFQGALDRDSVYAMAYADLGEVYFEKFNLTGETVWMDAAVDNCRRTIMISGQVTPAHVTLGKVYAATGRYEEAIGEFKQALDIDPEYHEAYRQLADAYQAVNMIDEAEKTYLEVIRLKPDYHAAHYDLGLFYLRYGRPDEAVEEIETVLRLLPENDDAYNNAGALYFHYGLWDNANDLWERSLAIKPNYGAYSNLGSLYYMQSCYAESAEMYEKALAMNDRDYSVWGNLAAVYSHIPEKSKKSEATYRRTIEMVEQLRRVNPRDSELLSHLGEFYAMVNDTASALSITEQALNLAPENIMIMVRAGAVYERLGERKRAIGLIERALDGGFPFSNLEGLPELEGLINDPDFEKPTGA